MKAALNTCFFIIRRIKGRRKASEQERKKGRKKRRKKGRRERRRQRDKQGVYLLPYACYFFLPGCSMSRHPPFVSSKRSGNNSSSISSSSTGGGVDYVCDGGGGNSGTESIMYSGEHASLCPTCSTVCYANKIRTSLSFFTLQLQLGPIFCVFFSLTLMWLVFYLNFTVCYFISSFVFDFFS